MAEFRIYHYKDGKLIKLDIGEWRFMVVAGHGVMIHKTKAFVFGPISNTLWTVYSDQKMIVLGRDIDYYSPDKIVFRSEKWKECLIFNPDVKSIIIDGQTIPIVD